MSVRLPISFLHLIFFSLTVLSGSYSCFSETLHHFAADETSVLTASCRTSGLNQDYIKAYFSSLESSGRKISGVINGLHFNQAPAPLFEAMEKLLTKVDLFGRKTQDQTDFSPWQADSGGQSIIQLAESIFGKKEGLWLLFLVDRYGFNGSHHAFENRSPLSEREFNAIFNAILSYPPDRFPLKKNKQLTRFLHNMRLQIHSDNTVAFAGISFYDNWDRQTEPMMEYTVFHELAHYIGSELELDSTEEWLSFSRWQKDAGETWVPLDPESFPGIYASESPSEDFAEAVSSYRYHPQLLKRVSPVKYEYIRETVFSGLEYTSDLLCDHKNSLIYKTMNQGLPEKVVQRVMNADLKKLTKSCWLYPEDFLKPDISKIKECIRPHISDLTMEFLSGPQLSSSLWREIQSKAIKKSYPVRLTEELYPVLESRILYRLFQGISLILSEPLPYIRDNQNPVRGCQNWARNIQPSLSAFFRTLDLSGTVFDSDYRTGEQLLNICISTQSQEFSFQPIDYNQSMEWFKIFYTPFGQIQSESEIKNQGAVLELASQIFYGESLVHRNAFAKGDFFKNLASARAALRGLDLF